MTALSDVAAGFVLEAHTVHQRCQRNSRHARADDARIQPGHIQQRVEKVFHDIHGPPDVGDDRASVSRQRLLLKCVHEEAQRVQRLTQVVTSRRQESGLGNVSFLGRLARLFSNLVLIAQLVDEIDVLEPKRDGSGDGPGDAVSEVGGGRDEHEEHRAQRHVDRVTFQEERHRGE